MYKREKKHRNAFQICGCYCYRAVTQFLEEQENPKTKRKTAYIELFRCFIQTVNPYRLSRFWTTPIHKISPTARSLNELLSKLIYVVRIRWVRVWTNKSQGFQVSSDTYGFIIFKDVQFKTSMATLKAKQKDQKDLKA